MKISNQEIKNLQKKIRSDSAWFAEQLGPELWGKEKEILNAVDNYKEVAVVSCNASGKALRHGTAVLAPNGWVNIENIRVGDIVIGQTGKPVVVNGVFPQGKRKLFRMTFNDRVYVDVDGEHLWKVKIRSDRFGKNSGGWRVINTNEIIERGGKIGRASCRERV